jgi:formate hydrogenlyase subunit 6/NADH:ubiquinone oxidoreductase subunit I
MNERDEFHADNGALGRRRFLARSARYAFAVALCGAGALLSRKTSARQSVWQIDPEFCGACKNCFDQCIRRPSAAKCVQEFSRCARRPNCPAFFEAGAPRDERCPTGAIVRIPLGDGRHQYSIDASLCIACGKCIAACRRYCRGSLSMQIRQDLCAGCNECNLALQCPRKAIGRIPASTGYI